MEDAGAVRLVPNKKRRVILDYGCHICKHLVIQLNMSISRFPRPPVGAKIDDNSTRQGFSI